MDIPSGSSSGARVGRQLSARQPGGRQRGRSDAQQLSIPDVHERALRAVRTFLRERSAYDIFPVSFRLIVLDHMLEIKKALNVLLANSVVSAPLWDGETGRFVGMFTVQDIIHLIQYYHMHSNYADVPNDVEQFRLDSLRDIERELNVPTPPLVYVSPTKPLWDACQLLISTHARRLPLIDVQPTGEEVLLSVLTQYRALKAISTNVKEVRGLKMSLRSLGIGTYVKPRPENPFHPIEVATMKTTVFDVVHRFSAQGVSAVPIVNDAGVVINLYETVDVITLVRLGVYQNLDLTIAQALKQRPHDFAGVVTCTSNDSLASLLLLIQKRRVHRLVVVEAQENKEEGRPKGGLIGIITLSDILKYLIGAEKIKNVGSGHATPVMPARAGGGPGGGAATPIPIDPSSQHHS